MKYNLAVVFFLLMFISNVYAYDIDKIDTKIAIRENGVLQISDTLLFTNIEDSNKIVLPTIPVYDLKIINSENISYFYNLSELEININNNFSETSLELEIIYLTDYYTSKQESIWTVNYFPLFKEEVNTLHIIFPKNTEIVDLSVDLRNLFIEDNHFVLFLDYPINSFDVNYSIDYLIDSEKNGFNFKYSLLVVFCVLSYFGIKLVFKKNKKQKKREKNLLLGLNENEQKIIKIIMNNNGFLQKNLAKETMLPKGTVSRNLKKLETKGYVSIKRYGVSKKVFLGEVFIKEKVKDKHQSK